MGPRPGHQSRVVVTWRRRPMYAEAPGQDPARANPAATRTRCAFGTAQPLIAKVISSLCARNKAIADGRIDVDRFFRRDFAEWHTRDLSSHVRASMIRRVLTAFQGGGDRSCLACLRPRRSVE